MSSFGVENVTCHELLFSVFEGLSNITIQGGLIDRSFKVVLCLTGDSEAEKHLLHVNCKAESREELSCG